MFGFSNNKCSEVKTNGNAAVLIGTNRSDQS